MGGLRGQDRTPGMPVRARRNAQNLASRVEFIDPAGVIYLDGDGYVQLLIDPSKGLEQLSAGIAINLATDPGLEFDSNNGIRAKVAAPVKRDSSGIGLNVGTGLTTSSSNLVLAPDYGELWTHTSATVTISSTNTWYSITGIDTAGNLKGATQDATYGYQLVAATAGKYLVNWEVSGSGGNLSEYHVGVTVDGAAPAGKTHAHFIGSGSPTHVSGTAILSLTASQAIWLQIQDLQTPSQDYDLEQGSINMIWIGE